MFNFTSKTIFRFLGKKKYCDANSSEKQFRLKTSNKVVLKYKSKDFNLKSCLDNFKFN